jgi:hypothetical protein
VKCGICQIEIVGTAYTFTVARDAVGATASFCQWCVNMLIGKEDRNRLELATLKAGWVQEPLPFDYAQPSVS